MADGEASLPKGSSKVIVSHNMLLTCLKEGNLNMPVNGVCAPATLQKMVREVLPPDIRIAGDAIDLVIECCSGATNLAFFPCMLATA